MQVYMLIVIGALYSIRRIIVVTELTCKLSFKRAFGFWYDWIHSEEYDIQCGFSGSKSCTIALWEFNLHTNRLIVLNLLCLQAYILASYNHHYSCHCWLVILLEHQLVLELLSTANRGSIEWWNVQAPGYAVIMLWYPVCMTVFLIVDFMMSYVEKGVNLRNFNSKTYLFSENSIIV